MTSPHTHTPTDHGPAAAADHADHPGDAGPPGGSLVPDAVARCGGGLVPVVMPPDTARHPAVVYLARLAPSGRRVQRTALDTIARLLCSGDAVSCPWWQLGYAHTQAVRTVLAEIYAPATGNRHLSALRGVLAECWRLGWMDIDHYRRAADLAPIRGSRPPAGRALTAGELTALFATCTRGTPGDARDAALLALGYGTGLRRAELVALDVADYQPADGRLTVRRGKGNRARTVWATTGTAAALNNWLHLRGTTPGPLLCPVAKDGQITVRRLSGQAVRAALLRRATAPRCPRSPPTTCGAPSSATSWNAVRTSPPSNSSPDTPPRPPPPATTADPTPPANAPQPSSTSPTNPHPPPERATPAHIRNRSRPETAVHTRFEWPHQTSRHHPAAAPSLTAAGAPVTAPATPLPRPDLPDIDRLEAVLHAVGGRSRRTAATYATHARLFCDWLTTTRPGTALADVSPETVEDYLIDLAAKGVAQATRRLAIYADVGVGDCEGGFHICGEGTQVARVELDPNLPVALVSEVGLTADTEGVGRLTVSVDRQLVIVSVEDHRHHDLGTVGLDGEGDLTIRGRCRVQRVSSRAGHTVGLHDLRSRRSEVRITGFDRETDRAVIVDGDVASLRQSDAVGLTSLEALGQELTVAIVGHNRSTLRGHRERLGMSG